MATLIASKASAPVYGAGGLITGYADVASPSSAQRPLYNSTGLISGYSSEGASPKSTALPVDPNDPTGMHVFDPMTGKNKQGRNRGEQAAFDYQQSTQTTKNVKSPEIAAATADALKQTQEQNKNIVKSFSDYLNEAKQLQLASKQQVAQDANTYDTTPKILESQLNKEVQDFADRTSVLSGQVTDLNKANADRVNANIASLDKLNADYEANARAVADRAVAAAQTQNNLYASTTGTPRSGSGYLNQLAAKTAGDILLPVEREISQNRINQLMGYVTPQQQQLYANNISQIMGLELPIAQALVNMGIQNAGQVANLKAALAGRAFNEQLQYLTSLGIPIEMAQRVAMALPQALGQIANIDQSNNFYGLAQDYQNPVTAPLPVYSTGVAPSYRTPPPVTNPAPTAYGQPNMIFGYGNTLPTQVTPPRPVSSAGLGDYAHEVTPYTPPVYESRSGPQYQVGFTEGDLSGAWAGGQFFPTDSQYQYPSM